MVLRTLGFCRILALVESSAAAIDAKEFLEDKKKKSFQTYSSNVTVDKTITMGKVEQSVEVTSLITVLIL